MGGARPGTPSTSLTRLNTIAVAVTLLFTAVAATACTSQLQQQGTLAPSPPAVPRPDADAAAVCGQFTVAALSSDSTTDRGPADGRRRAASQFGTPELAATLGGEGRDQTWQLLIDHAARIRVTTQGIDDDPTPARGGRAGAAVTARREAIGADGWRITLPGVVAYCSLTQVDGRWKVDRVTYSDTGPVAETR